MYACLCVFNKSVRFSQVNQVIQVERYIYPTSPARINFLSRSRSLELSGLENLRNWSDEEFDIVDAMAREILINSLDKNQPLFNELFHWGLHLKFEIWRSGVRNGYEIIGKERKIERIRGLLDLSNKASHVEWLKCA